MTKFLHTTESANPFAFMRRVTEELDRAFGLRAEVPGLQAFYPKMWAPRSRSSSATGGSLSESTCQV